MHRYSATFSITTPLFLGDAQREATRLSLQSLKGALRFWWRALVWEDLLRTAGGDTRRALGELHRREARIFGTAGEAGREKLGQARVRLRIEAAALGRAVPREGIVDQRFARTDGFWGARYLGYGLMGAFGQRTGRLDRSCFPAGGRFTVTLAFSSDTGEEERADVLRAVKLLGLLGGIGARTRRGWGSLTLERLDDGNGGALFERPTSVEAYRQVLKRLVGARTAPVPPFTAFSKDSLVDLLETGGDPLAVLDAMGRAMVRYRAWGYRGELPDRSQALRLFRDDHDWAKAPWQREGYVPRRTSFGLPHNYGRNLRNLGVSTTGRARRDHGAGDRRGSPLLLHVQDLGEGGFVGVATFLPAAFTPDGQVGVKWDGGGYDAPVPSDWTATITGWLEGTYRDPRDGRERAFFPERRRLVP